MKDQREQILSRWRHSVDNDPKVSAAAALVRAQFVDHVPRILDAFDRALRARGGRDKAAAQADEIAGAADHGEHRWSHGYDLLETMREWGHLHICMVSEFESYALAEPKADRAAVSVARTMLAQLFVDCVVESAGGHAALERAEAEGRLRELERALEHVRELESERTALWREVAHDLRGNVGAVKLAATALEHASTTPELSALVALVQRSANSLDTLLSELVELARLEAGREQRKVATFDAARVIRELCESLQPLAAKRQLFLKLDAPPELVVEGDAVKVRRIAQNLIINALKYTHEGGVLVSCKEITPAEVRRWALYVQDTGVGLKEGSDAEGDPGEGIGLSIVKRLCELLDASLELETQSGRGTTFRILFPSQYTAGATG